MVRIGRPAARIDPDTGQAPLLDTLDSAVMARLADILVIAGVDEETPVATMRNAMVDDSGENLDASLETQHAIGLALFLVLPDRSPFRP